MSAVARSKGTVKWFDEWRRFGFITPDEGGDELFVHKSSIKAGGSLDDGEAVEFVVAVGEDGRIKAADVVGLGRVFRGSCYNCGEKGHMEKDCDKSSVGGGGRFRRGGGGGSCYNCGEAGHLARECYNFGSCYNCGESGHHARDCYNSTVDGCAICGRKSHFAIQCLSEPITGLTMADFPPLGNGGVDSSVVRSQSMVKASVSSIKGSDSATQIEAGKGGRLLNGSGQLVQNGGGKSQLQGTVPSLATVRTGQQSSGKGAVESSDEVTSDDVTSDEVSSEEMTTDEDAGYSSSAGSSSSGSEIQADGDTELDLDSSPDGGTGLEMGDCPLSVNGGADSSVAGSHSMVKASISNIGGSGSATQIGAGQGGRFLEGSDQLVRDSGAETQRQGTIVPLLPTVLPEQQSSGKGAMKSSDEVTSNEAAEFSLSAGSSSSEIEIQADGDTKLDLDRAATSTGNPGPPDGPLSCPSPFLVNVPPKSGEIAYSGGMPMLAFDEIGVSDLFGNGKTDPSSCSSPVLATAPHKFGETTAYSGGVPPAQYSYVAFQKTGNMNDYSLDGKSVTMDDDIVDQNIGKFDNSLVGKLLGHNLSFSYLNAELHQKWLSFGEFRLILMLDDCFICIFNSLTARDSVLRGGPWFINEYVIALDTWSPDFNSSSMKGFSTPIWARLPSLPPIFWDPTNLGRIASMVGEPLWMDSGTISWDQVAYARVSVKADLSKPLLPGVWVHSKYQSFFQPMEYEGLSSLCYHCGCVSHSVKTCPVRTAESGAPSTHTVNAKDSSDDVTSDEAAGSSLSTGSSSSESEIQADDDMELNLDRTATSTVNPVLPDCPNNVDMTVPMLAFKEVGVSDLFCNGKIVPSSSPSPVLANAPPKSSEVVFSGGVPPCQNSYVAFQKTGNINDYSPDGKSVTMDDDIVDQNVGKFDYALVGKLLGCSLSFSYVNAELRQKWLPFGEFRLILMLDDCFICIFNSIIARDSALRGAPWFINEYVVGLGTWSPGFNSSFIKGFSTPIWVRLPSLPPIFWDPTNLGRIASMVGEPLWMDSGTISGDRVAYARISVKADLSKPLSPGVWVHSKYQSFFQPMEYEGLSSICYHCGCVSHSVKTCPVRMAESGTPSTPPVSTPPVNLPLVASINPLPGVAVRPPDHTSAKAPSMEPDQEVHELTVSNKNKGEQKVASTPAASVEEVPNTDVHPLANALLEVGCTSTGLSPDIPADEPPEIPKQIQPRGTKKMVDSEICLGLLALRSKKRKKEVRSKKRKIAGRSNKRKKAVHKSSVCKSSVRFSFNGIG